MIRNVIFDWSGTLSDDFVPVYTATMRVFKELGLKSLTMDEFRKEFTLPYMDFYRKLKKDADRDYVDKILIREYNSLEESKPFPKARETLEHMKRSGIRMILLSSCPRETLDEEIDRYRFREFFVDVNGSVLDKVEAILGIMEKNGFDAAETAYVGDMVHDIRAGKKAKVITVAVSWGYQTREKLSKEDPDHLIESMDELKTIMKAVR
jgi:phosphoglycolate phosphatase